MVLRELHKLLLLLDREFNASHVERDTQTRKELNAPYRRCAQMAERDWPHALRSGGASRGGAPLRRSVRRRPRRIGRRRRLVARLLQPLLQLAASTLCYT